MSETTMVQTRPTVLVVDDTVDNLAVATAVLKEQYRVKAANNGEKALEIAASAAPPDLILLDVMMPGLDGYEVCRRLKAASNTREIPVIFLTAMSETEDERKGLEIGAVDYILKPINPAILLARVRSQLQLKAAADFLRDKNDFLEKEVERRTAQVRAVQEVTILALASLAETRDNDTGNHLRRTQHYVATLARDLRPTIREQGACLDDEPCTEEYINLLYKSAPLHDIGKVGIPDRILLKPGKLEPDEFEIMKRHSQLGFDAIDKAERSLGSAVAFLASAKDIALRHHEKWDGSGYPGGLSGADIPLSARIMAVADVYDALISRRVYKEGMPAEKAARIIIEGAGSHFDPSVVEAFVRSQDRLRDIARRFADEEEGPG
ncbi:MAG: two-component system response regulator [Treponema sp.]|nr:two-component system response regulator [Treponema sp.]